MTSIQWHDSNDLSSGRDPQSRRQLIRDGPPVVLTGAYAGLIIQLSLSFSRRFRATGFRRIDLWCEYVSISPAE